MEHDEPQKNTLAARVKAEMKRLELTQADVAAACKVSQASVNKVLSGKTKDPTFIVELSEALGTSPQYLKRGTLEHESRQRRGQLREEIEPVIGPAAPMSKNRSPRLTARAVEDRIIALVEGLNEDAKEKLDVPMLMTMIYEACGRTAPLSLSTSKKRKGA